MDNVIVQTNEYIAKSNIAHLPLTFDELVDLIKLEGYEVFTFIQAKELIFANNLEEYIVNTEGFTYINKQYKAVLFDDNLPSDERSFVLAHELAHIILGHALTGRYFKRGNEFSSSKQDEEADEFAYQLLAPLCILRELDIDTPEQIMQITLLGRGRSERVLGKLVRYTPVSNDYLVLETFALPKNMNRRLKRKRHVQALLLLIMALFVVGVILLLKLENEAMTGKSAAQIGSPFTFSNHARI